MPNILEAIRNRSHEQQLTMRPGTEFPLGDHLVFDSSNSLLPGALEINNHGSQIVSNIDFTKHPELRMYVVPLGTVREFLAESRQHPITDQQAFQLYKGADELRPWDYQAHQGKISLDTSCQVIVKRVSEEGKDGISKVRQAEDIFRMVIKPGVQTGKVIITERIFKPEEAVKIPLSALTRHADVHFRQMPTVTIGENTIRTPDDLKLPEHISMDVVIGVDRDLGKTVCAVTRETNPEKIGPNRDILNIQAIAVMKDKEELEFHFFEREQTSAEVYIEPNRRYSIIDGRGCAYMSFTIDKNGNMTEIAGTEKGAIVRDGGGFRTKFSFEDALIDIRRKKNGNVVDTHTPSTNRTEVNASPEAVLVKKLQHDMGELHIPERSTTIFAGDPWLKKT